MKTKLLIVLGLLLVAVLTINPVRRSVTENSSELQLQNPSFLALAAEAQAQEKGVNFLQQEAGISAYVKVGPIDLAQVRAKFKSPETDITVGDEYINRIPQYRLDRPSNQSAL